MKTAIILIILKHGGSYLGVSMTGYCIASVRGLRVGVDEMLKMLLKMFML